MTQTQVSTSPDWSLDEVLDKVRVLVDEKRDPIGFQAAVFLAVSAYVGTSERKVYQAIRSLKIPRQRSREFANNLATNGIWKNGKVVTNWADHDLKAGQVAFLLDVLCTEGTHIRVQLKRFAGWATVPKGQALAGFSKG